MDLAFGLDFGTTNSALSVEKDGGVKLLEIDQGAKSPVLLRSIIYFEEGGLWSVGQEAIQRYLNEGATGRLIQSIKSLLPKEDFEGTTVNRKLYKLETLVSFILKTAKKRGEEILGHQAKTVVLGRPVVFVEEGRSEQTAQKRLEKAARLSGFENVVFEYEPVAAATSFEETLREDGEKILLVGDLGGGTSDFTIMKIRKGQHPPDRREDILALTGVSIGGDTFDGRIMWHKVVKHFGMESRFRGITGKWLEVPQHIFRKLCRWHLIPQLREDRSRIREMRARSDNPEALRNLENIIDDNFGFFLFQSIEEAKIKLSREEESIVDFQERDLIVRETISRKEFEEFIQKDIEELTQCIADALKQARLNHNQIDSVAITGGSSQIPAIQSIFRKLFGTEKIVSMDAFTGVAKGLGLIASRIQ